MKVNFLYDYKVSSGMENMSIDLSMLDFAIKEGKDEYYMRFYGWHPKCVSLGYHQKDFNTDVKIDIVRRPTGGRALLHDMELTYAIAGKNKFSKSVIQTYKEISLVFIKAFKNLGVNLEFGGDRGKNKKYCMNLSSGADICYMNKKLIGSAQCRKGEYFLQHGSILLDADYDFLEKVFGEKIERDKITTIKEIAPNLGSYEIMNAIKEEFEK